MNGPAILPPAASPRLPAIDRASPAAKTAHEFESVFLGQMTQMMLESVPAGGEFSGGHGEEMFRGVLAEKLGAEISKRGGIGLAPIVMDEIIKLQKGSR
jgi:Rod binding domain-containing protein